MIKALIILIAAVLNAVLYRMGGAKGYNTKYRDAGCSLVTTISFGLLIGWHWLLIAHFGLLWGALTTYWKKKGSTGRWYHFCLHGLACGLAAAPVALYSGHWLGFGLRCVVLAVWMGLWSGIIKNDVVEELGRGAVLAFPII